MVASIVIASLRPLATPLKRVAAFACGPAELLLVTNV